MHSRTCPVHRRPEEGCAHPPYPDQVLIAWSETRSYRAVVPVSDLAEAVRRPGAVDDGTPGSAGRELPALLIQLEGDPFLAGDLNGLLANLEDSSLQDVDDITVEYVRPAPGPGESS
jgi:hypothetical protein